MRCESDSSCDSDRTEWMFTPLKCNKLKSRLKQNNLKIITILTI